MEEEEVRDNYPSCPGVGEPGARFESRKSGSPDSGAVIVGEARRRSRGSDRWWGCWQREMIEDAADDRGIGDRGEDPAPALASGADQNVSQEHSVEQVGPRIVAPLATSLGRRSLWAGHAGLGLVGARRLWLLRDGDDRLAKAGGGSEDTVIGDEWAPWPGDQSTESLDEGGRREYDRAGTVLPFALEPVEHHPVAGELEPVRSFRRDAWRRRRKAGVGDEAR